MNPKEVVLLVPIYRAGTVMATRRARPCQSYRLRTLYLLKHQDELEDGKPEQLNLTGLIVFSVDDYDDYGKTASHR